MSFSLILPNILKYNFSNLTFFFIECFDFMLYYFPKSSPGFSVHNVGIPALSIVDPDCHGYIWKRGEIHKTWKRRYAVLKDGSLYYYKEMADTTAIGLFCLHNYHVNETESIGRKYSIIAIPPEPHWRTYYFSTETENDRLRYLTKLLLTFSKLCHFQTSLTVFKDLLSIANCFENSSLSVSHSIGKSFRSCVR